MTLLGVISDSAQKAKGRLRVTKFEITNFQGGQIGTDAAAKTPGVTVGGVTLDNMAVTELWNGLQNSGVFRKVELVNLKEREDKNTNLRDYEVRCEF